MRRDRLPRMNCIMSVDSLRPYRPESTLAHLKVVGAPQMLLPNDIPSRYFLKQYRALRRESLTLLGYFTTFTR